MAPLISLIVIITLSVLITKIATQALIHTGLSREAARFQARSAFTGVGFTTREAESIVRHPVRRRIILNLMFIGNVGIISAIASLMLTFINSQQQGLTDFWRIIILIASMLLLWLVSRSRLIERFIARAINRALQKFTSLNVKDYVELLDLTGEYEVTVLKVTPGGWLDNKLLRELNLRQEGINLIGIRRHDGRYIGTPQGDTRIHSGDNLVIYGREKALKNLKKRKEDHQGQQQHQQAVKDQEKELQKQKEKED